MKLKLLTQNPEKLKSCFSQISHLRKNVTLRLTSEQLLVILMNSSSLAQEPQIWCKLSMSSIFSLIEVQSIRNNVILLEVNIELFLQTLRNFEKSQSDDLSIRLQKCEGKRSSQAAYLALLYSDVSSENASTISHIFKIPVKILKSSGDQLKEPELPKVDLMVRLPNEFSAIFRRLEKFKNTVDQERLTISASQRNGGTLKFLLQEADTCSTTIRWNETLDLQKPSTGLTSDGLRIAALQADSGESCGDALSSETSVSVNLKDWCMAAKIVGNCQTITLFMCDNHACAIYCLLDDSEEAEVIYYISGLILNEAVSD